MYQFWNYKSITGFVNWIMEAEGVDYKAKPKVIDSMALAYKHGKSAKDYKKPKQTNPTEVKIPDEYKEFGIDPLALFNVKRLLRPDEWEKTKKVSCNNSLGLKLTEDGKQKVSFRVHQLKSLKTQLLEFYKSYTGYESYKARKSEATIFRAELINKLVEVGYSMYEIGYLLNKDRTTIYHHIREYNPNYYSDDWKKYITKVRQDINNLNWSDYEWKYL